MPLPAEEIANLPGFYLLPFWQIQVTAEMSGSRKAKEGKPGSRAPVAGHGQMHADREAANKIGRKDPNVSYLPPATRNIFRRNGSETELLPGYNALVASIFTQRPGSGHSLGKVKFSNEKLAGTVQRICRSIWAHICGRGRSWLEHLPSVPIEGNELYMRWPGERMPKPPPESRGPQWGAPTDWELAA